MSISLQFLPRYLEETASTRDPEMVRLTAWTWNRDSHDLFDYEAPQLSCQSFEFSDQPMDLFRKGNEIMAVNHGHHFPSDSEYIGTVLRDKLCGDYVMEQRDSYASKQIWSVVKDNWPEGVFLSEGQVVKLGRFKLRVRQICTDASGMDDNTSCSSCSDTPVSSSQRLLPDLRLGSRSVISSFTVEDAVKNPLLKTFQCRICLSEGPAQDDPLVCPCECSGSIKYVHARCLGHWLRGRLGLENHEGSVFFYRALACELCHCTYPSYYRHRKELRPLAFLPETKGPFVVFENVGGTQWTAPWNCDSSNTYPAGLHVVRFREGPLRLGRGHECEMRISDVSISRLHALVRLEADGSVVLQDQKSKFGTLTLIDQVVISLKSNVFLQSGRSILSFTSSGGDESCSRPNTT